MAYCFLDHIPNSSPYRERKPSPFPCPHHNVGSTLSSLGSATDRFHTSPGRHIGLAMDSLRSPMSYDSNLDRKSRGKPVPIRLGGRRELPTVPISILPPGDEKPHYGLLFLL